MSALLIAMHLSLFTAADDPRGVAVENSDYVTLEAEHLRCVVGNNKSVDAHGAGYNGVFSISSPDQDVTPYVPDYAGVNLEHYFDARPRPEDSAVFFEPRYHAMNLKRMGPTAVELHQPPTPVFKVESWTTFTVREPYCIDFDFRMIPREDVFEGGFIGVFWASYMNGPENKSIYFLGPGSSLDNPKWLQLCTQAHDRDSTVINENDANEVTFNESAALYANFSPLRYSEAFFYGRIRNMVAIYIFEPSPYLRFAHSPSGGGATSDGTDTNPAWDFQMIVPGYEIGQEYTLSGRVVYKPWVDRADVLDEVRKFRQEK